MSSTDNNILAYYYGFNVKPIEIKRKCETGYFLKKGSNTTFDVGAYGSISEVCLKSDCKYVVKLIPLSHQKIYKTFLREALIAPLMAKYGIGPKIHDVFTCLNAGYIIMDKWEGSIRKLTGQNLLTNSHLSTICDTIVKMHDKGVIHGDLHTANVLFRRKRNGEYEFCITDFGLSLYFEDKNSVIPQQFIPSSKLPNIFFPAFDFHRFSGALESRQNIIFIPLFFNKGYISLVDYLLVDKFYRKGEFNYTPFSSFIQKLNLNIDEIGKNKIDSSINLLDTLKNKKSLFDKPLSDRIKNENKKQRRKNITNKSVSTNVTKSLSKSNKTKRNKSRRNTSNTNNTNNTSNVYMNERKNSSSLNVSTPIINIL